MLVTAEEIKNETGFDVARLFNLQQGRPTERWIERQEQIILNYIRLHCYYGQKQLEYYLSFDNLKEHIKEAHTAEEKQRYNAAVKRLNKITPKK